MARGAIERRVADLLKRIGEAQASGVPVSPFWLAQESKYRELLHQIDVRMTTFGNVAAKKITGEQLREAKRGLKDALTLLDATQISVAWNRIPVEAIEALAGTLSDGSPLADLLQHLGARKEVSDALIGGLARGDGIREIAREIEAALNVSRNRAMNITRTETLRAYRSSTQQIYRANQDIVDGWVWVAIFSSRTCAMCLAMNGTEHPNSEEFSSHPSCRCTAVPKTKSFRELGIPVAEPVRDYGDATAWLRSKSAAEQDQILGKRAGQAFRSGRVDLQDFVRETQSSRWGLVRSVQPISNILDRAA